MRRHFVAELWVHDGDAAWHFVTLPVELADEIALRTAGATKGFGSVPVEVTVGATTWRTSLFPDVRSESFVLPMKKPVRRAEGLSAGDEFEVIIVVEV
jgi:hypothetical protein